MRGRWRVKGDYFAAALEVRLAYELMHKDSHLQLVLARNEALPADRIAAVETGGCPHAAIREDISANLAALEDLTAQVEPELLLCESGGDNLAAGSSIQPIVCSNHRRAIA